MEEFFLAMKLVFSVVVVGILSWILSVYGNLWHESQRVRKRLQMQGIKGPPPSFLHGNLPDMQRIQSQAKAASTCNSDHSDKFLAHDYTTTLFPYFEHWRKQYEERISLSQRRADSYDISALSTCFKEQASALSGSNGLRGASILHPFRSWSMAEKYPRLYSVSLQQHQLIRSMGVYQGMGWEWNFPWRRALFDNEITSAANFLRDIAENKIQQQGLDTWEWSADPEGQYSTRSAYDLIGEEARDSSQEECFEKLWRIKVPARFLVFAWRLLRDRLPTRQNLQRRQIQLTDSLCPLCRTQQEDASHLFFHCSKVQPIWWETMSWLQVKGAFPLSPK
ncbi:Cytochrome P450 714A1 [Glycine soja]|uniref:Cytochrome P450 714A1 n=1 Tax=Glycine soja TaxID=3848 RepID=A0A445M2N5_GLYSO|nr:Cytochrome P450 714A1 [Glycine soja]